MTTENLPWHIRMPSSTMQVFCGAPVTWDNIQSHGIGQYSLAKLPQKFRVTLKEMVSPNVHAICCHKCLENSGLAEAENVKAPF